MWDIAFHNKRRKTPLNFKTLLYAEIQFEWKNAL